MLEAVIDREENHDVDFTQRDTLSPTDPDDASDISGAEDLGGLEDGSDGSISDVSDVDEFNGGSELGLGELGELGEVRLTEHEAFHEAKRRASGRGAHADADADPDVGSVRYSTLIGAIEEDEEDVEGTEHVKPAVRFRRKSASGVSSQHPFRESMRPSTAPLVGHAEGDEGEEDDDSAGEGETGGSSGADRSWTVSSEVSKLSSQALEALELSDGSDDGSGEGDERGAMLIANDIEGKAEMGTFSDEDSSGSEVSDTSTVDNGAGAGGRRKKSAADVDTEGKKLVGKWVKVEGKGVGLITGKEKLMLAASPHIIDFTRSGGTIESVVLLRTKFGLSNDGYEFEVVDEPPVSASMSPARRGVGGGGDFGASSMRQTFAHGSSALSADATTGRATFSFADTNFSTKDRQITNGMKRRGSIVNARYDLEEAAMKAKNDVEVRESLIASPMGDGSSLKHSRSALRMKGVSTRQFNNLHHAASTVKGSGITPRGNNPLKLSR